MSNTKHSEIEKNCCQSISTIVLRNAVESLITVKNALILYLNKNKCQSNLNDYLFFHIEILMVITLKINSQSATMHYKF